MASPLYEKSAAHKPDTLTHLEAGRLTSKNDPRLKLRGKLDSAIALTVLIQEEFDPRGRYPELARWLADIRSALGCALRSEVTGEVLPPPVIGGMDGKAIHAISHHPLTYLGIDHLPPAAGQGLIVAKLNYLRTQVRETELLAADVYIVDGCSVTRPDIMATLNRLSSAVYVLTLLTYLAEQGKGVAPEKISV